MYVIFSFGALLLVAELDVSGSEKAHARVEEAFLHRCFRQEHHRDIQF